MHLIRAEKDKFLFHLSPDEKRVLFHILRSYPLVPPSHLRLAATTQGPVEGENQRLLEEALAEQRRENRNQVLAMLNEPQRFQETASGIVFTLPQPHIEWLLQVLNDVRVGSWLALGEPEELDYPEISADKAPHLLAMEAAGYLESVLLSALGLDDPATTSED